MARLLTCLLAQVYLFSVQDSGPRTKRIKTLGKELKPKKGKVNTKAKQAALYKGHSEGGERENQSPYSPCHHPGLPCSEEVCSCRQVTSLHTRPHYQRLHYL